MAGGRPAGADDPGFPPGTRFRADPTFRWRAGGRLLIGGSPLRFLRLTEAGHRLVRSWLAGAPAPTSAGALRLARRLVEVGLLHPEMGPSPDSPPATSDTSPTTPDPGGAQAGSEDGGLSARLTVVIPVKDDQAGLDHTLGLLPAGLPVIVVDDGSIRPIRLATPAPPPHITLIRRDRAGGPGVARQQGLGLVTTPLVAFVDAGVDVDGDRLQTLARWFADPTIEAVAPRVAATPRPDLVGRYEATHSPLDLGPTPSAVGHGRLVSYLPTACLLVRRAGLEQVGGFDPGLRFGEDVDLVWRLLARGQVRYDPTVVAHHPARASIRALARQRFGYGLAAAPLADRHGSALAPVRLSPWSLAVVGAFLARRPLLGLALAVYTARALDQKLASIVPDHEVESVQLVAQGHYWAGVSVADASARIWWPATVAALVAGSATRRPAALLLSVTWLRGLRAEPGSPGQRLRFWALRVIDDGAYGAGAWAGAIRRRSARCLAPQLVSWPAKDLD